MKDIIIVRPERCTGCSVCVRCCPAPEANSVRTLSNGKTIYSVDASKCIVCGECVRKCPQGARDYIDDTERFMSNLDAEKTIILADPAIKATYPTKWRGVFEWLKRKNLLIYDAAFGADICSWAVLSAINSGKVSAIISQHCAAVINYIKLYRPSLIGNLAPVYSPAVCAAIYIKKYLKRNNPIALLSPCIAKKTENIDTGFIEYNVTMRKLFEYFEKNDIILSNIVKETWDYPFDDGMSGQLGYMMSYPGGLRDNIVMRNPDVNFTVSAGVDRIYHELDEYAEQNNKNLPDVFDITSCEYGCNTGSGIETKSTMFDIIADVKSVYSELKGKQKNKGMFRSNDDKLFKKFDDELEIEDFLRSYRKELPSGVPTLTELEPIFDSMGMHTDTDRNYNCGICGYDTCYDMAVAVFRGLNNKDNCIKVIKSKIGGGEELTKLKDKCAELSEKIKVIVSDSGEADKHTADACEKAQNINSLLKNIVAFCNKKDEMDSASVKQMVQILETMLESFEGLDEDISKSKEKSDMISAVAAEISSIADSILQKSEK